MDRKTTGYLIAIVGSIISVGGTIANNLLLNPVMARELWLMSNPLLLVWCEGMERAWWTNGLGLRSIKWMYTFYTVTGILSFLI